MYKLTQNSVILRTTDNAAIPLDMDNTDYAYYIQWLSEGNTPEPADEPVLPTPLDRIRALEQANDDNQRWLNRQAAIDTALSIMCRAPEAQGYTRNQVHDLLYSANRGYKAMVDLEAEISLLRKQIV
jgi:hypothetical protein